MKNRGWKTPIAGEILCTPEVWIIHSEVNSFDFECVDSRTGSTQCKIPCWRFVSMDADCVVCCLRNVEMCVAHQVVWLPPFTRGRRRPPRAHTAIFSRIIAHLFCCICSRRHRDLLSLYIELYPSLTLIRSCRTVQRASESFDPSRTAT
jgi:hypothetical protein